MTTYVIGDIQGCYDPLMRLLEKVKFDPTVDWIWVTGDVVNRGLASLATLSFLYNIRDRVTGVLGNHDLTLLAVASGTHAFDPERHTFKDVLEAEEGPRYLAWLSTWPLLHYDPITKTLVVHAGLIPQWDLARAQSLSDEIQTCLGESAAQRQQFFEHLYGDKPDQWHPDLAANERWRFIVNVFTRIRFCTPDGRLDFITKEGAHKAPAGFYPWFQIYTLPTGVNQLLFGHWAALEGHTGRHNIHALDTGCVWGRCLSAFVLEEGSQIRVDC